MPELLLWGLVFIVSLIVLVKAADYFIDAAEAIGLGFGIPSFIIGLTIVSLGTSIPELASSIVATQEGFTEIVVSNVLGSNIANVFLVLGTVIILSRAKEHHMKFNKGDAFLLLGSCGWLIYACLDGVFSFVDALVCLFGLLAYVLYQFNNYRKSDKEEAEDRPPLKVTSFLILAASIVGIYFSAEYNIESIIHLAELLGVGKEFISLSAVALGTSLPELFVSITAIKKGKLEIAVGNVMGSNILNILAVMGIPGVLSNLVVPDIILSHGLYLLAIATLALATIMFFKKMYKWIGYILLAMYGYFIFVLVSVGG